MSSADGCAENSQFYGVGEQWERSYLGSTLICTCHGVSGIKCKSKPDGECLYIDFILWDTALELMFPDLVELITI